MTPVEKLEAAIAQLEGLRDFGTSGPWFSWHPESGRGNSSVDAASLDPDNPEMVAEGGEHDVELIVTLHATIAAQLAVLLHAIEDYSPGSDVQGFITDDGIALAEAILGGA